MFSQVLCGSKDRLSLVVNPSFAAVLLCNFRQVPLPRSASFYIDLIYFQKDQSGCSFKTMLQDKGRGCETEEVLEGIQNRDGGLDQSESCGSGEYHLEYSQIFKVGVIDFGLGARYEGKTSQW